MGMAWKFAAAAMVAVVVCWCGSAQAEAERVGVTAAVNPAATGHPPEGATRALFVGADVLHDERIVTTDSGQAQLLFLDQSALTVAPNSDITIDQFVYDTSKGTGKLAASVTKGALRFVGGRISKQADVVFTTPASTIGIRGGVLMIQVQPSGATTATFLFGDHMTVTAAGVTRTVTRPDFTVTVNLPNQPPGAPVPTPRQLITEMLHALEGTPGANGGATQIPTESRVALVNLTQMLLNSDPTTFVVTGSRTTPTTTFVQLPDKLVNLSQANSGADGPKPPTPSEAPQNGNSGTGSNAAGGTGGFGNETIEIGSGGTTQPPTRTTQTLHGYAAGVVVVSGYDGTYDKVGVFESRGSGDKVRPNKVTIKTSAELDQVSAKFRLEISGGDVNFTFGGRNGQSSFQADDTFSAQKTTDDGFIHLTMETHNLSTAFNDVPSCQCQYLQWGPWQATATTEDEFSVATNGSWVAGPLASIANFKANQPQGQATYSGVIVGNVLNNGSAYLASGQFQNAWNFGTRSGTISISNFDGKNFVGSAAATVANPRDYHGNFSGALANGTALHGTLNGSFFKSSTDVAAETGGQFKITSSGPTNYTAAGIFAAGKAHP
ncbi:MAG TPA: FecR domain-containing protein [Alphaproteobacteria bacterium]|nr:FecR domain-containing protein [Alphaproteobacteria bacterium]